jgi:3-oxoacyl-[acyl-carrier protein] reductase/meso-butanediol dehydrogenase/(S,S)-butanediol dehydrogenase/diacetyl reductase
MEFEQDNRLGDSHVVVTGGARGIGRGIAVRCAKAGADVSIFDTRPDVAAETRDAIEEAGSDGAIFEVDVTDPEVVKTAVADARAAFGPIDGLVNNAGVQRSTPILETSVEEWDFHFGVNAKGVFLCSKHVARSMISDDVAGNIVTISSVGADRPFTGQGAYGASKAAVLTFTKVLARELGEHGITANAIKPGTVETPMVTEWLEEKAATDDVTEDELLDGTIDEHIMDRIGQPEEIGHMAVLLLSEEGDWITGEAIAVDGGYLST